MKIGTRISKNQIVAYQYRINTKSDIFIDVLSKKWSKEGIISNA